MKFTRRDILGDAYTLLRIFTYFRSFADMPRIVCALSLLPINKLCLDVLRGLLSAHPAGKRIHQRAQISELADGTWMVDADCNRHIVHGTTRLQQRSCGHRAGLCVAVPIGFCNGECCQIMAQFKKKWENNVLLRK
ncbi:uncharacterized protein LOC112589109 isoform X1 [Harpegnathos saltator]|uniref:uncharacterized protein LOC112589109 isoform X1 n=1 Tax=Harpegnathos saltator TaxID=610380 RepID=UPI000DBEE751|nr:uncharacterized protein LOC112589109 isoform X1 [Harpegnathos saltator]XP_025156968.1 uncharacterized protein LOC112589109 isoform X1 [Harpegnathos saltator]